MPILKIKLTFGNNTENRKKRKLVVSCEVDILQTYDNCLGFDDAGWRVNDASAAANISFASSILVVCDNDFMASLLLCQKILSHRIRVEQRHTCQHYCSLNSARRSFERCAFDRIGGASESSRTLRHIYAL